MGPAPHASASLGQDVPPGPPGERGDGVIPRCSADAPVRTARSGGSLVAARTRDSEAWRAVAAAVAPAHRPRPQSPGPPPPRARGRGPGRPRRGHAAPGAPPLPHSRLQLRLVGRRAPVFPFWVAEPPQFALQIRHQGWLLRREVVQFVGVWLQVERLARRRQALQWPRNGRARRVGRTGYASRSWHPRRRGARLPAASDRGERRPPAGHPRMGQCPSLRAAHALRRRAAGVRGGCAGPGREGARVLERGCGTAAPGRFRPPCGGA